MIHRGYSRYLSYILFWNDIILLNIVNYVYNVVYSHSYFFIDDQVWLKYTIALNLTWGVVSILNPSIDILSDRTLDLRKSIRIITFNVLLNSILILGLIQLLSWNYIYDFTITYLIFFASIIITRLIIFRSLKWYRKKGYNYRNIILIDQHKGQHQIEKYLYTHSELGYRVKEKIGINNLESSPHFFTQLEETFGQQEIDEVFISQANITNSNLSELIDFCEDHFIKVRILSDLGMKLNRKLFVEHVGHFWFLDVSPLPMDLFMNRVIKRLFDILFSISVIILVLSWLIPLVSLIIYFESGFPVFFKQLRSGRKDQHFYCIKFRSMKVNNASDTSQATKDDIRVTKFGRILRKYSIDELPQFFNVLKGDMSIVGPRPHMIKHTEEYSKIVKRYFQRHHVKPGITGLAQIKGYRGEITHKNDITGRVNYDKFYIENWTVLLDIEIIFKTFIQLVTPAKKAY